jgi:hypothetical protein
VSFIAFSCTLNSNAASLGIHSPCFGADPNHRTKLVGKEVYELARTVKAQVTMTEMNAYRIKHIGYMDRNS